MKKFLDRSLSPVRRISNSKPVIFLICAVCYAVLFNLETSPFRYVVPSSPFTECPNNELSLDTCVYLYMGNLIPQGLMPYRDAFDHKGPLLYLIMALGLQIGNLAGVWLVQSGFFIVSAFYAYKTCRLLVSPGPASLASALAVLWYSTGHIGPETFSIPFLLIALFYFVRYISDGYSISGWETLLVGGCFGSVLLLKVNLTALWLVFAAVVAFVSIRRNEYSLLFRRVLLFLAGTALVSVPILLWLFVNGTFPDFIADYWHFNLHAYGDKPSFSNYLSFFLDRRLSVWIFDYWFNTPALLTYAFLFWHAKAAQRKLLFFCMASYLFLSILLLGIKGTSMAYYCLPLVVAYLIFFAISFDFILGVIGKHAVLGTVLFLFLSVPISPSICFPFAGDWIKHKLISEYWPETEKSKYSIPLRNDKDELDLAMWIKKNTGENSTLSGSNARVFWYSKRLCASEFFYFPPTKDSDERAYERVFVKDEKFIYPEYFFCARKESVLLTIMKILRPVPPKDIGISPEIEKTLTCKYDLIYQNERFDLYKIKHE